MKPVAPFSSMIIFKCPAKKRTAAQNGTNLFYYHVEPYKHNNYTAIDNHT